jgi:hypothetical protein
MASRIRKVLDFKSDGIQDWMSFLSDLESKHGLVGYLTFRKRKLEEIDKSPKRMRFIETDSSQSDFIIQNESSQESSKIIVRITR